MLYPLRPAVLCLISSLAVSPLLLAQTPPQPGTLPAEGLRVVVLSGANAINSMQAQFATKPVIEVDDGAGKPIKGALVQFSAPLDGPSIVFANGLRTDRVLTDAQGKASPTDPKPVEKGSFEYEVTVMYLDEIASAKIPQSNEHVGTVNGDAVTPHSGPSRKEMWMLLIGAGIAAGVGGGVWAAHR